METSEMSTLKGIIIPAEWDTEGKADKLALATYHEEILILEDKTEARNLMSFLKKSVVIEGVTRKNGASTVTEVHTVQEQTSMYSRIRKHLAGI